MTPRVQVRRRIVSHFAKREPAEVGEACRVLGNRRGKHFARRRDPRFGCERQVSDSLRHGCQDHRVSILQGHLYLILYPTPTPAPAPTNPTLPTGRKWSTSSAMNSTVK